MRVPIHEIPIEARRRAARALAGLTGDHVFPAGDRDAPHPTFGADATPIHRPDLDDVAYWEFELTGIRTRLTLPGGKTTASDRGFIVVATGGHDVPVPHFSLEQAPPSRRLEAIAGTEIDRIVKLDALCYAGEDAKGTMLAHIGTMPPKLVGGPRELPKRMPLGWARAGDRTDPGPEDGDRTPRQRLSRSRRTNPYGDVGPWRSWEECKKGYADAYRLHLEALAQRATGPWEVEGLTAKLGEGIRSGEPFTVILLDKGEVAVEGPGAAFVDVELNPQPLPPRAILTAKAGLDVRDTSFELHIRYGRESEVLPFFIVPQGAPTTTEPSTSSLGPVIGGSRR
jgi:hypothetical protein